MFKLGDEVYIRNPYGIDDGDLGIIDEIDGDRYRVRIDLRDGGSWWSEDELESAGAKSYYYSEISHPFRSLAELVYTECPCGCGSKEICVAQRARVKAHNDALPF